MFNLVHFRLKPGTYRKIPTAALFMYRLELGKPPFFWGYTYSRSISSKKAIFSYSAFRGRRPSGRSGEWDQEIRHKQAEILKCPCIFNNIRKFHAHGMFCASSPMTHDQKHISRERPCIFFLTWMEGRRNKDSLKFLFYLFFGCNFYHHKT